MNTLKNNPVNLIDSWLNENGDKEIEKLVARNVAISNKIIQILSDKDISRAEFAKLLDKHPSEITKLLSGRHNLNTKTIVKMEIVLGEDIISIADKSPKNTIEYIYLTVDKNTENEKRSFKRGKISLSEEPRYEICEQG